VVPLATPPKAERRVEVTPRANFGTFDSVAAEEKKPGGGRSMMIGAVAVLVIAAAATFTFLKMQKTGSATSQHAQEAVNTPPVQPAVGALSSSSQPGAQGTNGPASPAATAIPSAAKPAIEIDAKRTAGRAAADKTANAQADKPAPAERSTTIATLASGSSRITQNQAQQAPEIAPSFSVVSGSTQAPLSNLARPVATSTPSAAAIEQSQLEPLQLMKGASPAYPAIARARNITGTVVIQGTVGKDGKVSNLQFVSGPPIFKDAAFEAVRLYQFKPAKLNGQPIDQVTQIRLNFR
jgi:TonB family protein